MPHGTHDVGLMAFGIDGVAHGLAIDGQALVNGRESLVPLLQRTVKHGRIHAYEYVTDNGLAGNDHVQSL